MISLTKYYDAPWKKARGSLRADMDHIESALNQRWNAVFGNANQLKPGTISGASTADSRYVSNQGSGHTLLWDQVDLANGVKGTLNVGHGGTGNTAFTAGSIIFSNGTILTQDNAHLFWDNAGKSLTITGTGGSFSTNGPIVVLTAPDTPANTPFALRSANGGITFQDNSGGTTYGVILSGTTPDRFRITTSSGAVPLNLQENGGKTVVFTGGLAFGGTTASFPFLKNNGVKLELKLADASAFTTLALSDLFMNQNGTGTIMLGGLDADRSYGGLWLAQATPSFSNYSFLGHGGVVNQTLLNVNAAAGGTGDIECRVDNNTRFSISASGVAINFTQNSAPTVPLQVYANDKTTLLLTMLDNGRTFIGSNATPTAILHLKAGTASASTAPLKLTSGTSLSTPEAGTIEYDGTNFYMTP